MPADSMDPYVRHRTEAAPDRTEVAPFTDSNVSFQIYDADLPDVVAQPGLLVEANIDGRDFSATTDWGGYVTFPLYTERPVGEGIQYRLRVRADMGWGALESSGTLWVTPARLELRTLGRETLGDGTTRLSLQVTQPDGSPLSYSLGSALTYDVEAWRYRSGDRVPVGVATVDADGHGAFALPARALTPGIWDLRFQQRPSRWFYSFGQATIPNPSTGQARIRGRLYASSRPSSAALEVSELDVSSHDPRAGRISFAFPPSKSGSTTSVENVRLLDAAAPRSSDGTSWASVTGRGDMVLRDASGFEWARFDLAFSLLIENAPDGRQTVDLTFRGGLVFLASSWNLPAGDPGQIRIDRT